MKKMKVKKLIEILQGHDPDKNLDFVMIPNKFWGDMLILSIDKISYQIPSKILIMQDFGEFLSEFNIEKHIGNEYNIIIERD